MTKYGRSPWLDGFPKSRVPSYPRHRGSMEIEAVIVGGGLTGCAAAYAFATAGVKVMLLEAGQIGRGSTASDAGWIADDPGIALADLERLLGVRDARRAWQAWRRAALDFATLLRRLDVKCSLEARESLTVAATPDQVARLKREQIARRGAGINAPVLTAKAIKAETALDASQALRGKDGATIDPYRACVGLAEAAAKRGVAMFERSPVKRITFNRKTADVVTDGGTIRTRRVIVATAMPTPLFKALARHFWFNSTYSVLTAPVPARLRKELGSRDVVLRDLADPPHIIRWIDDERLLITGADAETVAPRLRDKTIVQRTGQLMYELSTMYPDISGLQPEYGWAVDYARTAHGVPYIGQHRNYPHHLFVFGDSSHSVTGSYLASRILLRQHFGEMDPAGDAFGFNR
jgi:glycine/D-amino acid oxidase-like deaminating enzyme